MTQSCPCWKSTSRSRVNCLLVPTRCWLSNSIFWAIQPLTVLVTWPWPRRIYKDKIDNRIMVGTLTWLHPYHHHLCHAFSCIYFLDSPKGKMNNWVRCTSSLQARIKSRDCRFVARYANHATRSKSDFKTSSLNSFMNHCPALLPTPLCAWNRHHVVYLWGSCHSHLLVHVSSVRTSALCSVRLMECCPVTPQCRTGLTRASTDWVLHKAACYGQKQEALASKSLEISLGVPPCMLKTRYTKHKWCVKWDHTIYNGKKDGW